MKNLEKDNIRLNSDKRLVEDELRRKQIELKQFKRVGMREIQATNITEINCLKNS